MLKGMKLGQRPWIREVLAVVLLRERRHGFRILARTLATIFKTRAPCVAAGAVFFLFFFSVGSFAAEPTNPRVVLFSP